MKTQNCTETASAVYVGTFAKYNNTTGTKNLISVPYGLKVSVEIIRENETAYVWVHAPLYMTKLFRFVMSYCSADFSDSDIMNDRDFHRLMSGYFPPERTQTH